MRVEGSGLRLWVAHLLSSLLRLIMRPLMLLLLLELLELLTRVRHHAAFGFGGSGIWVYGLRFRVRGLDSGFARGKVAGVGEVCFTGVPH